MGSVGNGLDICRVTSVCFKASLTRPLGGAAPLVIPEVAGGFCLPNFSSLQRCVCKSCLLARPSIAPCLAGNAELSTEDSALAGRDSEEVWLKEDSRPELIINSGSGELNMGMVLSPPAGLEAVEEDGESLGSDLLDLGLWLRLW